MNPTFAYALCTSAGIAAGLWLAARLRRRAGGSVLADGDANAARTMRGAALGGAVLGAYLFELPADLFGWSASSAHSVAWGGRTVLGGVLGGWACLELAKAALGRTESTAMVFTAPLALAFGFGRVGCWLGGCCQGRLVSGDWVSLGLERWPAPQLESAFDFTCAFVFSRPTVEAWLGDRLFVVFITLWALARFAIEAVRDNPAVWLGLTYYQWLALLLAGVGLAVWARRVRSVMTTTP